MKRRSYTRFTSYLLTAMLFTGCLQGDRDVVPGVGEGDGSFLMRFTVPIGEQKTRAVGAEPGENNINDLTLLFFDYTTNGTGSFVAFYRVPAEDIPSESEMHGDLKNNFDIEVLFGFESDLDVGKAYNILAFANMGGGNYFGDNMEEEFYSFLDVVRQGDENDAKRAMVMTVSGVPGKVEYQDDNGQAMPVDNLPMSAACTKEKDATDVECNLIRAVARFDVINKATGYQLVSASVWNAFPRGSVFDNVNVDYGYKRIERYYGVRDNSGLEDIHGGLYAFENVNTEPNQKDLKTTCLILGMKPVGGDVADISYYRVNINPKQSGHYLIRNNVYQITVSSVNGPGAGNEPDAFSSGDILIDTSINSWDRDEDGLIVRNETHMMALPTKRANFKAEAESREYFVYTMGQGTLEMSVLSMPDGMTAWLGGMGNDLHISVNAYDGDLRTGAIKLTFAGLSGIIEITQSGATNKRLELSHTQIPSWPAGSMWINMLADKPVRVNSSGPWTAKVYNGRFSFVSGDETALTLYGDDGDEIDEIYNTAVNGDMELWNSFVLVTLDEDPEYYRNVIVLSQLPTGSFSIVPDVQLVDFGPDGTLLSDNATFTVLASSPDDQWTVLVNSSYGAGDVFNITYDPGNQMVGPGTVKGNGKFTVTASGDNFDGDINANMTILHNITNQRIIQLHKDSYNFYLSHSAVNMVASGGYTQDITVHCTKPGATWSAVIESNMDDHTGMTPYLYTPSTDKVATLNNLRVEQDKFRIWMPGIDRVLTRQPKATAKITLDDNGLEKELVVTQEPLVFVPIHSQSFREDYGNWAATTGVPYRTFGKWRDEMIDPANFGPDGEVYAVEVIDASKRSEISVVMKDGVAPRIFNMNGVANQNIDFTSYTDDPNTVFIVYVWDKAQIPFRRLGLGSDYSFYRPTQVDQKVPRTIYRGFPQVEQTELWDYIFNSGPFGPVDPDKIQLHPQYFPAYMFCLSAWPDTFIPLIMQPTASGTSDPGYALVGVDPTNRVIWIGHKDMFGTNYGAVGYPPNWGDGDEYRDNLRFLRNLIAWMVNVNNYGDAFNERFKQSVTTR